MLHKNLIETSGFQELAVADLSVVSGGFSDTDAVDPFDTGGFGEYDLNGGYGYPPGSEPWDDQDEEIVVTADKYDDPGFSIAYGTTFQVADDHYAIYQGAGIWLLDKQSDWFWNQIHDLPLGYYKQVSPDETALILSSDSTTTTSAEGTAGNGASSAGGSITVMTNGSITTYWVPAY